MYGSFSRNTTRQRTTNSNSKQSIGGLINVSKMFSIFWPHTESYLANLSTTTRAGSRRIRRPRNEGHLALMTLSTSSSSHKRRNLQPRRRPNPCQSWISASWICSGFKCVIIDTHSFCHYFNGKCSAGSGGGMGISPEGVHARGGVLAVPAFQLSARRGRLQPLLAHRSPPQHK